MRLRCHQTCYPASWLCYAALSPLNLRYAFKTLTPPNQTGGVIKNSAHYEDNMRSANKVAPIIIFVLLLALPMLANAQNANEIHRRNIEMLNEIKNYCDTPPPNGKWTKRSLEGIGRASASRLIKKVVDIGFEVRASKESGEYSGFTQDALTKALENSYRCRENTLVILRDVFLVPVNGGNVSSFVNRDIAAGAAASGESSCITSAGPNGASVTCKDAAGNITHRSSN